jgi:NAD(P)-dependent dehydrogenase (short-subunit alcohol dehydrogenase family)
MSEFVKYNFAGKVALVTGAGAGMGLAAATAYAEAGAAVVLADHDLATAQAAADQLAAAGHQVLALACDVAQEDQVRAMIDQTVAKFGRLDMAFNNAGVMSKMAPTAELETAEWDRVQGINLRAVFFCLKYELLQLLKQGGGGSIVNSASIGSFSPTPGLATYIASKHGVIGLTKTAALEYATKGIRINAVCPGEIDTPMNDHLTGGDDQKQAEMLKKVPLGRLGKPEEIANAVLWLSSPDASYLIGHALVVDGGYLIP